MVVQDKVGVGSLTEDEPVEIHLNLSVSVSGNSILSSLSEPSPLTEFEENIGINVEQGLHSILITLSGEEGVDALAFDSETPIRWFEGLTPDTLGDPPPGVTHGLISDIQLGIFVHNTITSSEPERRLFRLRFHVSPANEPPTPIHHDPILIELPPGSEEYRR